MLEEGEDGATALAEYGEEVAAMLEDLLKEVQ